MKTYVRSLKQLMFQERVVDEDTVPSKGKNKNLVKYQDNNVKK